MKRRFLSAFANAVMAVSMVLASDAEADCNPPVEVSGKTVVWDWGQDHGDPTQTTRLVPVQLQYLGGAAAVAAGGYHTLALKNDGTVWAWGNNSSGQLGDGTTTYRD